MKDHVIIAGAGPTGLLTAIGLAKAGTQVTILEAGDKLNETPRALVYHYPVLPHLDRMGLLDDCIAAGFVRQDFAWRVHSSGEMLRWSLSCLDGIAPHPYALHLHQGELSAVLARHVAATPGVNLRFSSRVTGARQTDGSVIVEIDGPAGPETLEAAYLIGADGGGSTVRQQVLGLNFFGTTWPNRYLATNLEIDLGGQGYANATMQIDETYGSVICKIDTGNMWRVTLMEDPSLPEDQIAERIETEFRKFLPDTPWRLDTFSPYRMHQRVADRMRVGRILLVGDAAHITNPTGGLGLTGGMFDAFALIEVLNRVIHGGAGEDLLDFYDRDRRRTFIEVTSPRASDNLRTMYYMKSGVQKDDWIDRTRAIGKSDALMREAFGFTESMQTRFPGE
ncbi:NAD(P)/FAD-dependent oxidoreductase [uncultured Paracoccus sp.]|uniref:FAD-dependent oxidoreductase n=1 Tax=uncultured Paracoccus sp. TaxID=189685 RepID=UPI00262C2FBE|nr:NAD(P)/FAD-dependent oxidoreductase [uncultured Paracoccus sp.]